MIEISALAACLKYFLLKSAIGGRTKDVQQGPRKKIIFTVFVTSIIKVLVNKYLIKPIKKFFFLNNL